MFFLQDWHDKTQINISFEYLGLEGPVGLFGGLGQEDLERSAERLVVWNFATELWLGRSHGELSPRFAMPFHPWNGIFAMLLGSGPSLLGWRRLLFCIASRLEAIATRLGAIAIKGTDLSIFCTNSLLFLSHGRQDFAACMTMLIQMLLIFDTNRRADFLF